jgi:RNA polymerase sigma factor (sigma-70 family)
MTLAFPHDTADEVATDVGSLYLREIANHDLLTAEEEVSLAQRLAAGSAARRELALEGDALDAARRRALEMQADEGDGARRHLVECNLRLVVSVARRYLGRGVSFLDLVQEGNIGLQAGIDNYDWRLGFRVSTYVYWWIRQGVLRAIANQGRTIRLPGQIIDLLTRSARAESELSAELGRQPTLDEIGRCLDVDPARIAEARQAARGPLSLESPLGSDTDLTRADLLCDDAASDAAPRSSEASELSSALESALDELSPCERQVLRLRFGLNGNRERTLSEISRELGISRDCIRKVQNEGLRKLRRMPSVRRDLLPYLG